MEAEPARGEVGLDVEDLLQPARLPDLGDPGLELALLQPMPAALDDSFQLPELAAGLEQRLGEPAPLAGVEPLRVADAASG